MLSVTAQTQHGLSVITAIKNTDGVLVYDTNSIQSTFFYTLFYESKVTKVMKQSKQFLDKLLFLNLNQ